jgi:hypothetical protein
MIRPKSLQPGTRYLLRVQARQGSRSVFTPIRVIKYDPCPALVIVQDGAGRRWRCPREDLYQAPLLISG